MEIKTITISGIEPINAKADGSVIGYKITDENKDKYTMWLTKRNLDPEQKAGERVPSAAKEAWDGFKLTLGSVIAVSYSEEDNIYIDKRTGKQLKSKYPNRRIGTFLLPENVGIFNNSFSESKKVDNKRLNELPPSPASDGLRADTEKLNDLPF